MTQGDGVKTTTKKVTSKILSKSISRMPSTYGVLKKQNKVICHRIFTPCKITPIFGKNHHTFTMKA